VGVDVATDSSDPGVPPQVTILTMSSHVLPQGAGYGVGERPVLVVHAFTLTYYL
jgi:hypothetical protein